MEATQPSHARKDGGRAIASTGKDITETGVKIGLDINFEKNPAYLEEREKIWDELMEQQVKKLQDFPREEIKVTLPNGDVKEGTSFETSALDIAKSISNSLANNAVVASVKYKKRVATLDSALSKVEEEDYLSEEEGWILWDLTRPLEGDCELKLHTFADKEGRTVFWHSSSHVLGQCMEVDFGVHL